MIGISKRAAIAAVMSFGLLGLSACARDDNLLDNRTVRGAAIGAAGGAAVGAVVPGVSTVEGAAIGGAAGAVIGATGKDKDMDRDRYCADRYPRSSEDFRRCMNP